MLACFIWHHPSVGVDSADKSGSGLPKTSRDEGLPRSHTNELYICKMLIQVQIMTTWRSGTHHLRVESWVFHFLFPHFSSTERRIEWFYSCIPNLSIWIPWIVCRSFPLWQYFIAEIRPSSTELTLQGPLLAVVRQPKLVFRQRCFSDGARDSEFRQPRKFFRLSHSGEKWQCFPFKKFIQNRIWTCVFVRAVFSSAQAGLTLVQIAATSRRILQWSTMYVCRH